MHPVRFPTSAYFREMRRRPDRASVAESRDLDENTVVDLDANGQMCAMTIEHATKRAALPDLSVERVGSEAGVVSLRLEPPRAPPARAR